MNLALIAGAEPDAHRHFETIGSTNAVALEWASESINDDLLWVTADIQTAGRGRRGREWVSEPGNLYATALVSGRSASANSNLPLRAAIALRDAILRCHPELSERLALKWPNDLILDGGKLSGILLEATQVDGRTVVAVGFGVNCHHHPDLVAPRTTSLSAAGLNLSAAEIFCELRTALADRLKANERDVLEDWRRTAQGIGAPIVVRLPNEEIEGTFEDLADDGRLILARPDGSTQMIAAGDVFFPNPQGPPMIDTVTPERSVPHE